MSADLIGRLAAHGVLADDARADSEAIGAAPLTLAGRALPERRVPLPPWAEDIVDVAVETALARWRRS